MSEPAIFRGEAFHLPHSHATLNRSQFVTVDKLPHVMHNDLIGMKRKGELYGYA
jgi:hypothetical protein